MQIQTEPVTKNTLSGPSPGFRRGRAVAAVGVATVLVALLGYVREASLAARWGISSGTDAYFAATFVPNRLYLILIAGTLSPTFIPILMAAAKAKQEDVQHIFNTTVTFLLCVLSTIILVAMLTIRWWMGLLFAGFTPEAFDLSVRLSRVIVPSILCLGLAGLFTAVLNAQHRFAWAAITPAVSSLIAIGGIWLARGPNAIYLVAIATSAGFFLQFVLMLPAIRAQLITYRPVWNFRHPAISQLLKIGLPLFLYLVVADAKVFIERGIASHISVGAVSVVTYASRLFTVPSSLLAVPLAIVVYPQLAANALRLGSAAPERENVFHGELLRVVRLMLFIFCPVCLWMIVSARPVTQVLYEHGAFRADQTGVTSRLLMLYCIGILPNAITIFLLRCFYALQDTVTPLVAECIDMVFYVLAVPILVRYFGLSGLAITHAICFFVTCVILLAALRRKLEWSFVSRDFAGFSGRVLFCSAGMSIATLVLWQQLQGVFGAAGTIVRGALMGAVALFALITYCALAYGTRIPELPLCAQSLRRCVTFSRTPEPHSTAAKA